MLVETIVLTLNLIDLINLKLKLKMCYLYLYVAERTVVFLRSKTRRVEFLWEIVFIFAKLKL